MSIGDVAYFLMAVTELHVVPGHAIDFIVVLAITLKRMKSQCPQLWHAADDVERELTMSLQILHIN